MFAFPATHVGRCSSCGDPFDVGANIFYDHNDQVVGLDCCGADDAERGSEESAVTPVDKVMPRGKTAKDRCETCFQVPASNGVCGCA